MHPAFEGIPLYSIDIPSIYHHRYMIYPRIAIAMAPASFPKGRHGSVDAFTNCAWPCHSSAFLGTEPVVQHMWKKTSSPIYWEISEPHLLRNIWIILNQNLGTFWMFEPTWVHLLYYMFFKTSLNQLWHHQSIVEKAENHPPDFQKPRKSRRIPEPSGRDNKLPIWLHTWGNFRKISWEFTGFWSQYATRR